MKNRQEQRKVASRKEFMVLTWFIFKPSENGNDLAVDNSKWYIAKKLKPDVAAMFAKTNEEQDFAARESVYDSHREELQVQIRYISVKVISQVERSLSPPFNLGGVIVLKISNVIS